MARDILALANRYLIRAVAFVRNRPLALLAASLLLAAFVGTALFFRLSHTLDSRLADARRAYVLYSAPAYLSPGNPATTQQIVGVLRAAGYTEDASNSVGSYRVQQDTVEVIPGPQSYAPSNPVRIRLRQGLVASLESPAGVSIDRYGLEPRPLARLTGGLIQSHHPLHFEDLPKALVNALLAAEDKRFFHHPGFDPLRLVKATWVNVRNRRKEQGGSTLTMQLARNLYLGPEKTWGRKLREIAIATVLETRLSKQEIFEQYVNSVYLGTRGGIPIHGFGEAARILFSRDLSDLTSAEAALLAGMVQRPAFFDPVRNPKRALARRNTVLRLMKKNGSITDDEMEAAVRTPISIRPSEPATFLNDRAFLRLAADEIQQRPSNGGAVYTSLDPELQRDAAEAVRIGLLEVDKRAARTIRRGRPEVALVALDSHTGEVKALIGGRDFSQSQLNHATAQRQPGSVFKPFVYAAALQSKRASYTAATILNDDPISITFRDEEYSPTNWGGYHDGQFTLRHALAMSNNIAAVALAEQVGYADVRAIAIASGLNERLGATPSLALGSYETSPLEMAASYTVFANGGTAVRPIFLTRALLPKTDGSAQSHLRRVLSPPVAFIMQDLLTEVLRSGTGAGVHSRGFHVPAAGKTGTSRDGWFVGYVSNLICAVWIGYDDNADLKIEGANSALPVWTEFMKRASQRREFRQPLGGPPSGIAVLRIDAESGLIAGERCEKVRYEYFIRGTEPKRICTHEAGSGFVSSVRLTSAGN